MDKEEDPFARFAAPATAPAPAAATAPRDSRALIIVVIGVSALLGVLGGLAGNWGFNQLGQVTTGIYQPNIIGGLTGQLGGQLDAQALAARVDPAIVDINTVTSGADGTGQGSATGLILTSNGDILTNNHVVEGSTSIRVTVAGRSGTYAANVVGVDPTADVALVHLNGVSGLPTVKLGDISTVRVGEAVVALGNALGQGGTPNLTEGTITGVDQTITASDGSGSARQLNGMLETDASIVPGDSGGALVDSQGQVVGMITAGSGGRSRFSGNSLGYAVPASTALGIVNRIRSGKGGSDIIIGAPGYIGVTVAELDPASASQAGISSGVAVSGVQAGSPADRAGLGPGAVITAVGSTPVTDVTQLGDVIHPHHPGEKITVTWVDPSGSTHRSTVTLVSGPAV